MMKELYRLKRVCIKKRGCGSMHISASRWWPVDVTPSVCVCVCACVCVHVCVCVVCVYIIIIIIWKNVYMFFCVLS